MLIGVNLAGILGDAEADPTGLVGSEVQGAPGQEYMRRGLGPASQKKTKVSLEMACSR